MNPYLSIKNMILINITKGNFNTSKTEALYLPEKNLRFHFKKDDRYFEYGIDNVNSRTINLYCIELKKSKCKSRLFLILADCLVTLRGPLHKL